MGLDGVGRGGTPGVALPRVDAPSGPQTFQAPTEADSVAPAGSVAAQVVTEPTPLDRWRAGEIDREGYLDLKVDDATARLQGLHPEELDAVKTVLRGQLASDPALGDLVRHVTGKD
jgi:hypothetical protein